MNDRFPRAVASALIDAGWRPDRRDEERAKAWGLEIGTYISTGNGRHAFFPAAVAALAEFGGLVVEPAEDGEDVAPSGFALDPLLAVHTVAALTGLGERIGARLTPIGAEHGGVAALAIDEQGRVFALDPGGEWFLGQTIEDALSTLVLGRRPARVRADGTWL